MPSTNHCPSGESTPHWRDDGSRYFRLHRYFRDELGGRVWKLSVDAGLGCPNRAGGATGPCVFCDIESFSPSRRMGIPTIAGQIAEGIRRVRARTEDGSFVAYFQPGTNTFAPAERLETLYEEALAQPGIVGLVIGTRPDAVRDDALDLLARLAERTWVLVELGLQTVHDRSLRWLSRGHDYASFVDCVERIGRHGLACGVHAILGIPGESSDDMAATAREINRLGVRTVKLHNLYAVRNTPLAAMVASGKIDLGTADQYVDRVVDFLEVLRPDCVVDRLASSVSPEYLIAPVWAADSSALRRAIQARLVALDTWQGCRSR